MDLWTTLFSLCLLFRCLNQSSNFNRIWFSDCVGDNGEKYLVRKLFLYFFFKNRIFMSLNIKGWFTYCHITSSARGRGFGNAEKVKFSHLLNAHREREGFKTRKFCWLLTWMDPIMLFYICGCYMILLITMLFIIISLLIIQINVILYLCNFVFMLVT